MPPTIQAQPFLKWVGGKRSLLTELHSHLPESFNRYYEPFIGGGALFFSLAERISEAILSDNNFDLVLTYLIVKKKPLELIGRLRKHATKHSTEYFYKIRKTVPNDDVERAARFIYLNKTCYNGLYRVNQKGEFNAPIGDYAKPNILQEEVILACSAALQKARIIFGDFEKHAPRKGDFVYCDPPYHPTSESSFISYTKNGFTEKDQERLRDWLLSAAKKGADVMVSNSKTDFIEKIYQDKHFKRYVVHAPRSVNCKPTKRNDVQEFLITSF